MILAWKPEVGIIDGFWYKNTVISHLGALQSRTRRLFYIRKALEEEMYFRERNQKLIQAGPRNTLVLYQDFIFY